MQYSDAVTQLKLFETKLKKRDEEVSGMQRTKSSKGEQTTKEQKKEEYNYRFLILSVSVLQRQADVKVAELQRATSTIGKLNVEFQDIKVATLPLIFH